MLPTMKKTGVAMPNKTGTQVGNVLDLFSTALLDSDFPFGFSMIYD